MEQFIPILLEKGGTYLLLVGVLYYLFTVYIPRKDLAYERRIDSMMLTFQDTMKQFTEKMDKRLSEIERGIIEIERVIISKKK